jgi:transcriptional regulator with XRE-family HTH domain
MSISELDYEQDNDAVDSSDAFDVEIDHPLHRIKEVRQQQGVSLRRVAQLLGAEVRELRREEEDTYDLPLSRLYQWQRALEVPIADLLVDSGAPLSAPVLERARLVRVMKTVAAIMEKAHNTSIQRLAQTLVDQLVEIMPELKGINPWHSVGQRRSLDEYGRIVERSYSDDIWREFWREG